MADKIIDFQRQRESHVHKRKEARVDALRRAFRRARAGQPGSAASGKGKRRK
jgi:hypothetical protein